MLRHAIFAAATLATPAGAACGPGFETFLSCTFSGGMKALDVCSDSERATYAFGPAAGPPELALATTVADLDYEPWPGIGRTIWERVTFRNGGVAYVVHGAIERDYPADAAAEVVVTVTGGIEVMRGEEPIATLACDPGSADFAWGEALSNAKARAGLCLDHASRTWTACK